MKRNSKDYGFNRQSPLSGFHGFVKFALAFAFVWVLLFLAPQGVAATGAVKNSYVLVCTLNAMDVDTDNSCKSSEVKPQVFLSGLSRCCEQSRDHKQMPESCQAQCPATGHTLSSIWDWQFPAYALLAMRLAPLVIGAPYSLLHQRLNRPPITGRLA